MVAPRKKAAPAKKAAAQLAKDKPGQLRKAPPSAGVTAEWMPPRQYAVMVRKPNGREYVQRVMAVSAAEARAAVEATLVPADVPVVVDVYLEGPDR